MKAASLIKLKVIAIPPDLSLRAAHALMKKHAVRHLPVVSEGKLAGILSDRDILLSIGKNSRGRFVYPDMSAGEVMTLAPISAGRDTPASELARVMMTKKIDALPILSTRNELVGLVTSSDLLALVAESTDEPLPRLAYEIRRVGVGGARA